ncbi:MAG: hypothetical protein WBV59_09330 [Anaerolineae bacterium]
MQRQNIVRILVLFVLLFAAVGSVTAKSPDGKDHAAGLPSGNYPLDSSDNVVLSSGGPANINVSPLSLASTQATNTQTQQVLTIGNTSSAGSSDLTWTVFEDANGSPELVDWSDNFDSYATGSQMHGQGGWKGWANDPAAGARTSSIQARSAPNSVDILGASDLVHEYSGYSSGSWVYTAWQYVPTDYTGQSYFILLNTYVDVGTNNWSVQVQFDAGTNLVVNEGATGGTLPLIKGQWVELRDEINLDVNTQSFYYNNQLLYTGTWTDEVSVGGVLNIGAVDLFANNATTVFYDDVSLAAPVSPLCDAPSDIPWVSETPSNGTTVAGASTPVQVTFDSTGLAVGTYTGNLCVSSNDPDPGPGNGTNLVIVPLTLDVQAPTALTLSSLDGTQSPAPMPVGLPLAALPLAAGAALAAAYAWRRKQRPL